MKPHKQTTSAVSSIAGKYVRMTNKQFYELLHKFDYSDYTPTAEQFFRDIRKLAASCLAQDETPSRKPRPPLTAKDFTNG